MYKMYYFKLSFIIREMGSLFETKNRDSQFIQNRAALLWNRSCSTAMSYTDRSEQRLAVNAMS